MRSKEKEERFREMYQKPPLALQLSGSEELPPGYRAMVEEYYRRLVRKVKK